MNLAAWAEKADPYRRVARVTAWATSRQTPVDKVVTGLGSALGGHRRQFLALPGDPSVRRIVVEQRDGLSPARHFRARRKAFNRSVAVLKADIAAWRVTGAQMATPSLRAEAPQALEVVGFRTQRRGPDVEEPVSRRLGACSASPALRQQTR